MVVVVGGFGSQLGIGIGWLCVCVCDGNMLSHNHHRLKISILYFEGFKQSPVGCCTKHLNTY